MIDLIVVVAVEAVICLPSLSSLQPWTMVPVDDNDDDDVKEGIDDDADCGRETEFLAVFLSLLRIIS